MTEPTTTEQEIAEILVESLNLEVAPEDIEAEEPLFGDGLGLDSIDALELAAELSRRYGFQLRSDDPDSARIYSSLRSLAAHVDAQKSRTQ